MSSAEPVWTDRRVVADLMLRNPKTLPGDARVADVRAVLDNPRVQLVLLADGQRFRARSPPADADPEAGRSPSQNGARPRRSETGADRAGAELLVGRAC